MRFMKTDDRKEILLIISTMSWTYQMEPNMAFCSLSIIRARRLSGIQRPTKVHNNVINRDKSLVSDFSFTSFFCPLLFFSNILVKVRELVANSWTCVIPLKKSGKEKRRFLAIAAASNLVDSHPTFT